MRLQHIQSSGIPSHISQLLNAGGTLPYKEFLCRLVHICMIEVGFIPVVDANAHVQAKDVLQSEFSESVPIFCNQLHEVIKKSGTLQSVSYRAITTQKSKKEESLEEKIEAMQIDTSIHPTIPLTGKESGDGSEMAEASSSKEIRSEFEWRETYTEVITVGIIFEEQQMIIIASGPDFHKNVQLSPFHYILLRTITYPTATPTEYLENLGFSPYHFVSDIKRKLCYPLMDEIDGQSFDIRSLSWLPDEIIVEIAKHCSPVQVFKLMRTCTKIREALGSSNAQFWKFLLKRDFPQYNFINLESLSRPARYYDKYCELCMFTYRRPVRRTTIFPHGYPPTYLAR